MRRAIHRLAVCLLAALAAGAPAAAQDVVRPAEVQGLLEGSDGVAVQLSWDPVTTDVLGHPETISHYRVYRGETPDFVPDKTGDSNLLGTALLPEYSDDAAAQAPLSYYYLISAVDADGNESDTKPAVVTTPPVLSGYWTSSTIELDWTAAAPAANVAS